MKLRDWNSSIKFFDNGTADHIETRSVCPMDYGFLFIR